VSTKSHRVCHDVVADRFLVKRLGGQSPGRRLQHLSRRDSDRGSKRASFRRSAHDQNHPLRIRQNIQRTRARSIGGLECAYRLFIADKLSAALKDGKAPLNPIQTLIVSTEINTEELIKYSANAFFAMRVTLSMKSLVFTSEPPPACTTSPERSAAQDRMQPRSGLPPPHKPLALAICARGRHPKPFTGAIP
jgi:hypothetical protein